MVKINNFDFDKQKDTGSGGRLYQKFFWERSGNPTLQKNSLQLHQFNGSVIKL